MARVTLITTQYSIQKLPADGGHIFLRAQFPDKGAAEVFFRDRLEEKKVFDRAEMTLQGEWIPADGGNHLIHTHVVRVHLLTDIPLQDLSIKDRLHASGLIHEFRDIFRKDKMRAMEILKVLGVPEKFAEEILLRNSYVLPFI